MRKRVFGFFVAGIVLSLFFAVESRAEWTRLSGSAPEADIRWIVVDSADPNIFYVSSQKHLYKTVNDGRSWKRIFTLPGFNSEIYSVYLDPMGPGRLYLATGSGVWEADSSGKNRNLLYQGIGEQSKKVFCAVIDPAYPQRLWFGTAVGLVVYDKRSGQAKKIASFPNTAVYSILIPGFKSGEIFVLASDGIYQSTDEGAHWQRALGKPKADTKEEDTLRQMSMEVTLLNPLSANLIYQPVSDKIMAATSRGIYQASPQDLSWEMTQNGGAAQKINYLAASSRFLYAATDRGIFRWDPAALAFTDISEGLESRQAYRIFYEPLTDRLLAATKKGVYQFLSPDAVLAEASSGAAPPAPAAKKEPAGSHLSPREILRVFDSEPTIGQIQKAAIEYAEVHPRKIQEWRAAAQKKAWLPTVSLSQKINRDRNVDIDRGGTGDVDRFIEGPEDVSNDWSVGMSWDLGDLVWNDDQTSIDTRSRLMVELRDDVLNEVTHLYYERRRLQVQIALHPAKELRSQVDQELRLQELTAGIDGLTGGYLSSHLKRG